jgi:pimeloyl-ACP methyl ester carboxylesterase
LSDRKCREKNSTKKLLTCGASYKPPALPGDTYLPLINGRILAFLIPNASLKVIDDGHLFMVTRPGETADVIEDFLRDNAIGGER